MAEFEYQGVDRKGVKQSGKLEAASEGDVRMILREQGIRPTRISKGKAKVDIPTPSQVSSIKVPIQPLVLFTRQLQVLLNAGVPLVQALDILVEQTDHPGLKSVVASVRDKVSQGSFFWEALSAYPRVFPRLFIALVRAGEASGALEKMFQRLSTYLESADKMGKMIKSAMMYPIVVLCIALGVIAGMLIFVIPKFEEMLKSSNQEMPLPTQIVVNLSHGLQNNLYSIVLGGIGAFLAVRTYLNTQEGKAQLDRVLFRLPLFGPLIQKSGIARFSRTLQTLLASGVNLIDAIEICKATIDNAVLEEAVGRIRAEVESGKTLGSVISKMTVFPRMATQMISVGESTGSIDKMLEKVAEYYDTEVEATVSGMGKLIEPLMMVFIGAVVGTMLIAMYLPIFKVAGGGA